MLNLLKRLSQLSSTDNHNSLLTESNMFDPDYGQYSGHPMDPRTPPEDEDIEVSKELLSRLMKLQNAESINDIDDAELLDIFMQTAKEKDMDLDSQFSDVFAAVEQDLKDSAMEMHQSQYESPDLTIESLKQLSGVKTVSECGDMGMGTPMQSSSPHTPASLNVTANSGPELAGMLRDLMSLAGVRPVAQTDMPVIPSVKMVSPGPDMRKIMDTMNDETVEEESDEPEYDNTPASPLDVPEMDSNKFAYDPNAGGDHRERQAGLARSKPVEESTSQSTLDTLHHNLFAEYQKFIGQ